MPGNFVSRLAGGKMFQWKEPTRAVKIQLSTWGSYNLVVQRKALIRDEMLILCIVNRGELPSINYVLC